MPPLPLRWGAWHVPKAGHAPDEYEDAWAADPGRGRFAVADGAAESSYAALWARLLAGAFVAAADPADVHGWLDGPRQSWDAEVMGLDLPWYAEVKREEGAFATFLGLDLQPAAEPAGTWRAVAVGDSCLVRVRGRAAVRAFPLRRAADFDNRPGLLGSRVARQPRVRRASGRLRPGDRLFLMTDALAQWFLAAREMGGRPWAAVGGLLADGQPEAFAAWVEELRAGAGLRNDDTTLIALDFPTE